jgi:hypothetical protein
MEISDYIISNKARGYKPGSGDGLPVKPYEYLKLSRKVT